LEAADLDVTERHALRRFSYKFAERLLAMRQGNVTFETTRSAAGKLCVPVRLYRLAYTPDSY
jgi:hypothetical protein